jgi:signal transduction histidine kinase
VSSLLSALQLANGVLFVLVGLAAAVRWLRDRRPAAGWLALVIGGIALTAGLGQVAADVPGLREYASDVAVVAFVASGYGMLRFRGTFIPLDRRAHLGVCAGLVALTIAYFATRVGASTTLSPVQSAVVVALVVAWAACLVDPLIRFSLASMGVPAVQRGRLLSLATAFAAIALILLVTVLVPALGHNVEFELLTQTIALLTVPLLYFSFAPPSWLRAAWRAREEEALRAGMRQLLLFSPTRKVLAERAIEGAVRLVGGDGALIADGEGVPLAARGISSERARELLEHLDPEQPPSILPVRGHRGDAGSAIVVPLTLSSGTGALIVTSGPFTPYFGADEVDRLRGFATSISAGLDRTVLTERLAALERTKSEFLNLASHELRGPITLLRGYLSMIASGALGDLTDQVRQALPVMELKADEMNSLVEQMIEAARLEEGRLELHPVDTDLRELAQRAVDMIRPLADGGHELVVDQPSEAIHAVVDPERIGTILGNLLSNAIKYSPRGGKVSCRVRRKGGYGVISVTDEGVGIPAEQMDKLFTRFGRLVTRDTEHIGGTGLGLYLSRELARMHGGDVTVESEPGQGSTFSLSLPLGQGPAAA